MGIGSMEVAFFDLWKLEMLSSCEKARQFRAKSNRPSNLLFGVPVCSADPETAAVEYRNGRIVVTHRHETN